MDASPHDPDLWDHLFVFKTDKLNGYVYTYEQASDLISKFEECTTTSFSAWRSSKADFGNTDVSVLWKNKLNWHCGTPYFVVNRKTYDCHQGVDRHKSRQKKIDTPKDPDHDYKKRLLKFQTSKKFECPAQIKLKEQIAFPMFKIDKFTKHNYRKTSEHLKDCLQTGTAKNFERRIWISLPAVDAHKNHIMGKEAGILQPVDKSIISRINTLVKNGVTDTTNIKIQLDCFVKENFPQRACEKLNRRFNPDMKAIRDHIYLAQVRQCLDKDDQVNLKKKVETWSETYKDDKFHCQLKQQYPDSDKQDKFQFVYQSAEQRRLLERYGEIALLDATYKTTKYALPLFFLCVKTNVNYQVVGMFMIENETTDEIIGALEYLKTWNPNWQSKYFMTDFDEKEINALERTFEGSSVYLCDFHREKAWTQWVNKAENGVRENKVEVLSKLRCIAKSKSEADYKKALASLKKSSIWLSRPKLQHWFETYWIPHHKRWVWAFRSNGFQVLIKTNNGVERQNELLKYGYLKKKRKSTVSQLITILIEKFFPDGYRRYSTLNYKISSGYKHYAEYVPSFLVDRPHYFLQHCMEKLHIGAAISNSSFKVQANSIVIVKSATTAGIEYTVNLGAPSCECESWRRTFLPCKHMFGVMQHVKTYSWHSLPYSYRESVFFRIDELFKLNAPVDEFSGADDALLSEIFDQYHDSGIEEPHVEPHGHACNTKEVPISSVECLEISKKGGRTTLAAECRDLLDQIRNLTYLTHDMSTMQALKESLMLNTNMLKGCADKENGFLLEEVCRKPKSRKKKKKQFENKKDEKEKSVQNQTSALPTTTPGSRKRRYGAGYENFISNSNVAIDVQTGLPAAKVTKSKEKDKEKVFEEVVLYSTNDNEYIDENLLAASGNEEIDSYITNEEINSYITVEDDDENQSSEDELDIHSDTNLASTSNVIQNDNNKPWLQVGGMQLLHWDKEILMSEDMWLNDRIINAAQGLLKTQFPHMNGLGDTLLQMSNEFQKCEHPKIQVLNRDSNHWYLVSSICLTDQSKIEVYDSKKQNILSYDTKKQLALLLKCHKPTVTAIYANVQQQEFEDNSSCGIFSIAFATSLCFGDDPRRIKYDIDGIRKHLFACLKNGKMEQFPAMNKNVSFHINELRTFRVYCICRLPHQVGDTLLRCTLCGERFHHKCENNYNKQWLQIPTNHTKKWYCKGCHEVMDTKVKIIDHGCN